MRVFFWLFLLVMLLLLPGIMLFFGNEFLCRPGSINGGYGQPRGLGLCSSHLREAMEKAGALDAAFELCGYVACSGLFYGRDGYMVPRPYGHPADRDAGDHCTGGAGPETKF